MKWLFVLIIVVVVCKTFATPQRKSKIGTRRYQSAQKEAIRRAIPESFDESVFQNKDNTKFKFPKYKSTKKSLIEIKDESTYKDDIWELLKPDEKRTFSIIDFEKHFDYSEIEVESFWKIFDKVTIKSVPYLKEEDMDIEGLDYDLNEIQSKKKNYLIADNPLAQRLLEDGFLSEYEFKTSEEKQEFEQKALVDHLNFLKVSDLKEICKKNGLKTTLKKAELIKQILIEKCEVKIPKPFIKNKKYDMLMNKCAQLYIEDVKKTIDTWHPLIIQEVWKAVSTDADFHEVEKMAKGILKEAYWEDRLKTELI